MGCDWAKLVATGRQKAIGVPWTPEEDHARLELKIPVEFIRNGCLTLEDYRKATAELSGLASQGKDKPIRYMNKAELQKKAGELGIQFTPEVTNIVLRDLIQSKLPRE